MSPSLLFDGSTLLYSVLSVKKKVHPARIIWKADAPLIKGRATYRSHATQAVYTPQFIQDIRGSHLVCQFPFLPGDDAKFVACLIVMALSAALRAATHNNASPFI